MNTQFSSSIKTRQIALLRKIAIFSNFFRHEDIHWCVCPDGLNVKPRDLTRFPRLQFRSGCWKPFRRAFSQRIFVRRSGLRLFCRRGEQLPSVSYLLAQNERIRRNYRHESVEFHLWKSNGFWPIILDLQSRDRRISMWRIREPF